MEMRNRPLRAMHVAVIAGIAGTAVAARAAVYNDSASGNWDAATTWSSSDAPGTYPLANTDSITIDSNTVTATYATFTGGNLSIAGSGVLQINYSLNANAAAGTLSLNGGRIQSSRMKLDGITSLAVQGTSTVAGTSNTETFSIGTATVPAVVTGSGTLVIAGPVITGGSGVGRFELPSPNGSSTGDNNATTFSGTYSINSDAAFISKNRAQTKYATVNLNGGLFYPNYYSNTAGAWVRPEVLNLTGSGDFCPGLTGYYADLQVNNLLDPGTLSAAGTIRRRALDLANNTRSRNDLILTTGADVAFDIFGPTQAQADQIVWKDANGISGILFSGADLKVRLYTPSDNTGALSWTLIDADEWISGGTSSSSATTSLTQSFASISFLNADGTPVTLWSPTQSGWKDLTINTDAGTAGDRRVVLTGEYVVVPEPGLVALLAASGMLLGLRRQGRP